MRLLFVDFIDVFSVNVTLIYIGKMNERILGLFFRTAAVLNVSEWVDEWGSFEHLK